MPKEKKGFKVVKFEDEESWLSFRVGKITGTSHIVAKKGGYLKDYWQILADKLSLPSDGEDDRERGRRLEPEAIQIFRDKTKKKVDTSLVMWVSEENEDMAISPDGFIGNTEAVESKTLDCANHLQVFFEQEIPSQFYYQKIQYFVINPHLKTLHFVFYNPLVLAIPFFVIEVQREDVEDEVRIYKEQQIEILEDIKNKVLLLSNF